MNLSKPIFSNGPNLVPDLQRQLNNIVDQVNGISSFRIASITNAYSAAPTGGTWAQGDFVTNSAPIELGSVGSKYVITGWRCISGGAPGLWVQDRSATGN